MSDKNIQTRTTPFVLVKERRDYTVNLKISGISTDSIIKQVNNLAKLKGWGIVTRATVERDIAKYFKDNRVLTSQDFEHQDNLREAHIASMEKDIEQLVMYISKRDKMDENKTRPWKAFEKVSAIETLHKIKMNYAEAQNWNLGRKNPMVAIQQNSVTNIYDRASIDLAKAQPKAVSGLVDMLESAVVSLKEEEKMKEIAEEERVQTIVKEANTKRDNERKKSKGKKDEVKNEILKSVSQIPNKLQVKISELSKPTDNLTDAI